MNITNINSLQNTDGSINIVTGNNNYEVRENDQNKDTAVVVNISKEGRLIHQNQRNLFDEENAISHMEENKGEIITKRTLKSIIEDVRNGKELSDEDQKQLNRELEEMVNTQYDDMKSRKLSPEDERVLKELKNSYMMKQRSLEDMKKNLEAEKLNSELEGSNIEQTQKMEAAEKKKALVESLFEELEDEKTVSAEDSKRNKTGSDEFADSISVENDKENAEATNEAVSNTKINLKQLETNEENLDKISGIKGKAVLDEKYYSKLLDEEYITVIDTIKDKNMPNLEKVNQYEHFMDISEDLMISREVAKHVKIFNHRAAVDLKMAIRSNGSISLAEFMLGKKSKSEIGREFINKF